MCAEGLVRVISRAAIFCFNCKRWICSFGRLKRSEFPMSKREVMKAWTSCSVACGVRNLRICPRFLIWKDADLTVEETSMMTPRFRTCLTGAMLESPILICRFLILSSFCLEPMIMNSVLLSLSLRPVWGNCSSSSDGFQQCKLQVFVWNHWPLFQKHRMTGKFGCHQHRHDVEGCNAGWYDELVKCSCRCHKVFQSQFFRLKLSLFVTLKLFDNSRSQGNLFPLLLLLHMRVR